MNTIFDFKRTGLLIQRHFIERFQSELIFWGVSIICILFIRNQLPALTAFAMITCAFRSGLFFKEIHSPTNRINYFMIPATQIEKFVVSILCAIVYFWAMMFVVYAVGNVLGTWLNNLLANVDLFAVAFELNHQDINWVVFNDVSNEITANPWLIATAILIIQSLFLLGGIYFKKNQVLKTFFALIIIGVFLIFIFTVEAKYFVMDNYIEGVKSGALDTEGLREILGEKLIATWGEIILKIFFYLCAPYLWVTAYIRLTEKEV
jgi:hypothetical protein